LSVPVLSAHASLLSLSHGPRSSALKLVRSAALSLFRGPRLSEPSPRTARALHRGRAHDCAFSATPARARAFSGARPHSLALPRIVAPQPSTLALSLALRAHPGSSTAVHHGLVPVRRSPSSPRRVCCLGELHLVTRDPRHPSVRSFPPLFFSVHTHRFSLCPAIALPPSTRNLIVPRMPFVSL
jgi:hypothetical protein